MILDPSVHAACIHGLKIVLECYALFCLSLVTLGLLVAGRYILPAIPSERAARRRERADRQRERAARRRG